jgi:F0F1-type ATP synthase membrane subunit b/b'
MSYKYGNRKLKNRMLIIAFTVLLCSLFLAASPQEEAAAHGEEGSQGFHFNWFHFLGQVFNSTILFGGLILLLRTPILKFLNERSVSVKIDIVEREENLKKTAKMLEEIKNRLDRIEEEVETIRNSARKSGEEEKEKIKSLGKQEAERIVRLNNEEITRKVESSIRRLKEQAANLTIEQFRKEVKEELDDAMHEKIIEKNIEQIGELIARK